MGQSNEVTFTLESLEDLRPAPYNPRAIDDDALMGLQTSLVEFGDLSGIVWNQRTGHLVAGHQRLRALVEKYGHAVKLETDGDGPRVVTPDGTFPVRLVDWDEVREKAANVAANSPLLAGRFTDGLAEVLVEVDRAIPELYDSLRLGEIDVPNSADGDDTDPDDGPLSGPARMELQPFEHWDSILIVAKTTTDWEWLCEFFELKRVNASPLAGQKKIGLGRAVSAERAIAAIKRAAGGRV